MNNILWLVFEIGINLYQGYLATLFVNKALTPKYPKAYWLKILNTVITASCCSLYLFFELPSVDTWIFIPTAIYVFVCFEDNYKSKLFWILLEIVLFIGVTSACFSIMSVMFGVNADFLMEQTVFRIIWVVMTNITLLVAVLVVSGRKQHTIGNLPAIILFIVLNLLVMMIIDMMYLIREQAVGVDNELSIAASMALGISIVAVALYEIMVTYAERYSEMKRKEENKKMELQRLEELQSIYSSLDSLRHDVKNHVQIAMTLLESGQYKQGSDYLAQIDNRIFSVFSTGSLALDSELTLKELTMRRMNINFEYDLCYLEKKPIPDFELCTVIGNLLDNAIEAISRSAEEDDEKTITLQMRSVRKMLCIRCTNPADESILVRKNGRYITSKKQKGHGLGIVNIETIVKKANGYSDFSCKNGTFTADISIPMRNKEGA